MNFTSYIFFYIIVVAFLNTNNVPPAVPQGQQQAIPLSSNAIYTLSQRIIQMMQAYGIQKLTNGNGTNFWDHSPNCLLH